MDRCAIYIVIVAIVEIIFFFLFLPLVKAIILTTILVVFFCIHFLFPGAMITCICDIVVLPIVVLCDYVTHAYRTIMNRFN